MSTSQFVRVCHDLRISPVPIYDGMNGVVDVTRLHHLSSDLKLWEDDLVGKMCLVGYTANSWIPKDNLTKQLSLNIQWVIVLAKED